MANKASVDNSLKKICLNNAAGCSRVTLKFHSMSVSYTEIPSFGVTRGLVELYVFYPIVSNSFKCFWMDKTFTHYDLSTTVTYLSPHSTLEPSYIVFFISSGLHRARWPQGSSSWHRSLRADDNILSDVSMEAMYHWAGVIPLPATGPVFKTGLIAAHPLYHCGPKGSLLNKLELQFCLPPCQISWMWVCATVHVGSC